MHASIDQQDAGVAGVERPAAARTPTTTDPTRASCA